MPPTNLRSMVAQGGRWVVSGRNFSSSPRSVESKGENRYFNKLIAAWRVLIGVTSVAAGYGLGAVVFGDGDVVLGNVLFGTLKKALRRKVKAERESRAGTFNPREKIPKS